MIGLLWGAGYMLAARLGIVDAMDEAMDKIDDWSEPRAQARALERERAARAREEQERVREVEHFKRLIRESPELRSMLGVSEPIPSKVAGGFPGYYCLRGRYCPACGWQHGDYDRFCVQCGNELPREKPGH
jgi:hypothetical protein